MMGPVQVSSSIRGGVGSVERAEGSSRLVSFPSDAGKASDGGGGGRKRGGVVFWGGGGSDGSWAGVTVI